MPVVNRIKGLLLLTAAMVLVGGTPSLAQVGTIAVPLVGNHPMAAETEAPAGQQAGGTQLAMAVTLQLRNAANLNSLLAQLQDPASPSYHHWLTPAQFAAEFGPTQSDVDAVVTWLQGQGFTVQSADSAARLIRFTGTTAQAQSAFHTTLYSFGGNVFGNITDPQIPAQFAGVIAQIHGLDNMRAAHATARHIPGFVRPGASLTAPHDTKASSISDGVRRYAAASREHGSVSDATTAAGSPNALIGASQAFGPADFATFFDSTPLGNAGINGSGGDCIAVVGDSDFEQSSVDTFDSSFGIAASNITTVVVGGSDPGVNSDEEESLLDLEWSHAVAPGAATRFYVGNSSTAVIAPIVDEVSAAVNENQCGVITISFSLCGGTKSFYTGTVSPIYAQAAVQGQSIVISSGDEGAADLTFNSKLGCVVGTSRNVSQLAADPNVTAIGGASFNPAYDGSSNDTSVVTSTALRAWNDPNDGIPSGGASGGGASGDYGKPAYQYGLGVPADNKRDLPDVALIASPYFPGAFVYIDGNCSGAGCDGTGAPTAEIFGGTSLAAPAWAGIAKLVAQQNSVTRLGSLNPKIYQLANSTVHASIFQDVTNGNNKFNGVSGFSAGAGFDLVTGWGTTDISALATNWFANVTPLGPQVVKLSPTSISFGNVDFAVAGAASKTKKLTITNPKKYQAVLQITSIVGSAGFTSDPACNNVNIAPGAKLVCNITYTPTAFGAASGSLTIASNSASSPQIVATSGTGILGALHVSPGSLNFSKIPVNTTSAAKTITLDNDTGSTFTIGSIANGNPAFVPTQNCVSTLPGLTDCTISVTYTPTATAKVTDTMTISDSLDGITETVKLTGTGQ